MIAGAKARPEIIAFGALAVLFVAETLLQNAGVAPAILPDSEEYLAIAARHSLTAPEFWIGARLPGYPLFLKALQGSVTAVVGVQIAVYLSAWTLLAWRVFGVLSSRPLRIAGAAAIFLLALLPSVASWNHIVMTESLTLSLLARMMAAALRAARSMSRLDVAFAAVLGCAYVSLRDTNALHAGMIGALLLAAARWTGAPVRAGIAAATLIVVAALGIASTGYGPLNQQRWVLPLTNVYAMRILASPELTVAFAGRGMPHSDDVARQAGRPMFRFERTTPVFEFRDWVRRSGRAEYARYLATHPAYLVGAVWQARSEVMLGTADSEIAYYASPGFRRSVLFPHAPPTSWILALVVTGALAVGAWLTMRRQAAITPELAAASIVIVSAVALIVLSFHADGYEVPRHCAPGVALVLLGGTIAIACAIDRPRGPGADTRR
jgi:hypothetical protein